MNLGGGSLALRMIWLAAFPAVFLVVLGSALGCSESFAPSPEFTPTPTATPTPELPLDAQGILERAADRMVDLHTASFVLEHLEGSTTLFPGIEMTRASGEVDLPDRYRVVVEAESATPQAYIEVTVVGGGGKVYMTDFFTGRWRRVPASSLPVGLSEFGGTLAGIIHVIETPEISGTESVSGVETLLIEGRVESKELAGLVPGAARGFEVGLRLWVELPDGLVHQVLISGQVLSTDTPETQRLLALKDFDIPVDIELPDVAGSP